jgi:hypothetical protein
MILVDMVLWPLPVRPNGWQLTLQTPWTRSPGRGRGATLAGRTAGDSSGAGTKGRPTASQAARQGRPCGGVTGLDGACPGGAVLAGTAHIKTEVSSAAQIQGGRQMRGP